MVTRASEEGVGSNCLWVWNFFWDDENVLALGKCLHNFVNTLKTTELYLEEGVYLNTTGILPGR